MDQASILRWNAQEFQGFWFLTNFLNNEGIDEPTRHEIVHALTDQYESFRLGQVNKNPFNPYFRIEVRAKHADVVRILMEKSTGVQPGKCVIGEIDLVYERARLQVRQRCLI